VIFLRKWSQICQEVNGNMLRRVSQKWWESTNQTDNRRAQNEKPSFVHRISWFYWRPFWTSEWGFDAWNSVEKSILFPIVDVRVISELYRCRPAF
jgi:hypothetical protein